MIVPGGDLVPAAYPPTGMIAEADPRGERPGGTQDVQHHTHLPWLSANESVCVVVSCVVAVIIACITVVYLLLRPAPSVRTEKGRRA